MKPVIKLSAGLGVFTVVVSIVLCRLDSEGRPGLVGAGTVLHPDAGNHIIRGSRTGHRRRPTLIGEDRELHRRQSLPLTIADPLLGFPEPAFVLGVVLVAGACKWDHGADRLLVPAGAANDERGRLHPCVVVVRGWSAWRVAAGDAAH